MTDQEWALFAAEIEGTFRGDFAEDRELFMREHVGRVPYVLARAAVRDLVMHEQVFAPSPGEMIAALRRAAGGDWGLKVALSGLSEAEYTAELYRPLEQRYLTAGDSDG